MVEGRLIKRPVIEFTLLEVEDPRNSFQLYKLNEDDKKRKVSFYSLTISRCTVVLARDTQTKRNIEIYIYT